MTSSSASSPARRALEEFVAGRMPAARLVATVTKRFYGAAGQGERDALRRVVELAERAAPGAVSLERTQAGVGGAGGPGGPGFDVRAVERPFPTEYEDALRAAAAAALEASWSEPDAPAPGWLTRVVGAVRRLFSASA